MSSLECWPRAMGSTAPIHRVGWNMNIQNLIIHLHCLVLILESVGKWKLRMLQHFFWTFVLQGPTCCRLALINGHAWFIFAHLIVECSGLSAYNYTRLFQMMKIDVLGDDVGIMKVIYVHGVWDWQYTFWKGWCIFNDTIKKVIGMLQQRQGGGK